MRGKSAIGYSYFVAKEYEKAIPYYRFALDLGCELKDRSYRAGMIFNLANCYSVEGKVNDAVPLFQEVFRLDLAASKIVSLYLLNDLLELALCGMRTGDMKPALEANEQALEKAKGAGQGPLVEILTHNAGSLHAGKFDQFLQVKALMDQFEKFERVGDIRNMAAIGLYAGAYLAEQKDQRAVGYFLKAASAAKKIGDRRKEFSAWNDLGHFYIFTSYDYEKALACFRLGEDLANRYLTSNEQAMIQYNMGNIYKNLENDEKAIAYYNKAIALYKRTDNNYQISYCYLQMNLACTHLKAYDQALSYLDKAMILARQLKNDDLILTLTCNNAWVHYLCKEYSAALKFCADGLAMRVEDEGIRGAIINTRGCIYRDAPAAILTAAGIDTAERYRLALHDLNESLDIARRTHSVSDQRDNLSDLSQVYAAQRSYDHAYASYKEYIVLRDSIKSTDKQMAFANKYAQLEYARKTDSLKFRQSLKNLQQQQVLRVANQQKDIARLDYLRSQASLQLEQNRRKTNEQKLEAAAKTSALQQTTLRLQKADIRSKHNQSLFLMCGIIASLLLSFLVLRNYLNQRRATRTVTAAHAQLNREKERSDQLLLNILPADVAVELMEKGSAEARLFDEVTVLFTDFVNFTALSEQLTPQQLVNELHYCFKVFDEITGRYQIEKIKTIGDAYLAVAGLPNPDTDHAWHVVQAALEINHFVQQRRALIGEASFDVRIGVHSGSVVAGIVGVKKFAYDIWGDTVNTAARMEQHSEPGKVNVSERTFRLVADRFRFNYRGEIAAKNKGMLKMYFASPLQDTALMATAIKTV